MSPRRAALVLAAAAAALPLAACGGRSAGDAGSRPGPIVWDKPPQVFVPRGLPTDRVAVGTVRNDSLRPVRVLAWKVVVRDGRGHGMQSAAGFTAAFAHGLFGAFQQPSAAPTAELVRLGKLIELKPGEKAPLFAAWRVGKGASGPMRIDYGRGDLSLPAAKGMTAR